MAAERLYNQIRKEDAAAWKLDTTVKDLETGIGLQQDAATRDRLSAILERLKALLPPQGEP